MDTKRTTLPLVEPFRIQFLEFARRKTTAATNARLQRFTTLDIGPPADLQTISDPFADGLLDGPFFQSPVPDRDGPAFSLVFVQSAGGNTEADDPSTLGGGETDKHVIYEGLSRVAADAVMAGASTARDGRIVFSVWHPALVRLRERLGKPRHPAQVIASASGNLNVAGGLLFNVPEISVVILTTDAGAATLHEHTRARPWITVISSGPRADLTNHARRLRRDSGILRVSAIGGRSLATGLIDAGLISDLYLTTSPFEAGTPNTPMYGGTRRWQRELVVRKRSGAGVVFEHFVLPSHPGESAH